MILRCTSSDKACRICSQHKSSLYWFGLGIVMSLYVGSRIRGVPAISGHLYSETRAVESPVSGCRLAVNYVCVDLT